jgi:uncharacterized protein (TIGR04255 family)
MVESEIFVPLGGLPPAEHVMLEDAQIDQALVEVQLAGSGATELSDEQGLALRQVLASRLDLVRFQQAQEQQLQFALGPTGPVPSPVELRKRGWQFDSVESGLNVVIMPDKLLVQTSQYTRWSESLRMPLAECLNAIKEIMPPTILQRIGVRYINRLTKKGASSPVAWKGLVSDPLLGALNHEFFGPLLGSSQQQIDLTLGKEQGAILRHGAFRDPANRGGYSYLLDIDVYDTRASHFDVDDVASRATILNRTAFSIFTQSITPEFFKLLSPQPLPPVNEAG